jgi:hypothetical protein
MLAQHTLQRGGADASGSWGAELAQDVADLAAVPGHQTFPSRLEEIFDSFPGVGNQASAGPGRLKDARRR